MYYVTTKRFLINSVSLQSTGVKGLKNIEHSTCLILATCEGRTHSGALIDEVSCHGVNGRNCSASVLIKTGPVLLRKLFRSCPTGARTLWVPTNITVRARYTGTQWWCEYELCVVLMFMKFQTWTEKIHAVENIPRMTHLLPSQTISATKEPLGCHTTGIQLIEIQHISEF